MFMRLRDDLPALFPDPNEADPEGLVAVGGDLTPDRLVAAYCRGIFPWFSADTPILWWSPDPRCVLLLDELHLPRRLTRTLRTTPWSVRWDTAFAAVCTACAQTPRPDQDGTWITASMHAAYTHLHQLGLAHSVETWQDDQLVGGLYGIALGRAFFGESMFHVAPDASKLAFAHLALRLRELGFHFIDCQQVTAHMLRFGARPIARREFLNRLRAALLAEQA